MKIKEMSLTGLAMLCVLSCFGQGLGQYQFYSRNSGSESKAALLEMAGPPQIVTFSSQKGTTFQGRDGTIIDVPPNAFDCDCKVEMRLREVVTMESMILNGATTTNSDGDMLVTGGMVELRAFDGERELELREGAGVGIALPTDSLIDGMKLYEGERIGGEIAWDERDESFEVYEDGRVGAFRDIFGGGSLRLGFDVRLNKEQRREAQAEQERKRKRTQELQDLGMKVKRFNRTNMDRFGLIRSTRLGWLNCDKLPFSPQDLERQKEVIFVNGPVDDHTQCMMILNRGRTLLEGDASVGGYYFEQRRFDSQVELLAIRIREGRYFLSRGTWEKGKAMNMQFIEYNREEFKTELSRIGKGPSGKQQAQQNDSQENIDEN